MVGAAVGDMIKTFIDYSIIVVIVLIIFYGIKFLYLGVGAMRGGEDAIAGRRDRRRQRREERTSDREERGEERSTRRERRRREGHIRSIESNLLVAINEGQDVINQLRRGRLTARRSRSTRKARSHLQKVLRRLRKANNELRKVTRRQRDRQVHSFFDRLYNNAGVALHQAEHVTVPNETSTSWSADADNARHIIAEMRAICGDIVNHLQNYLDNNLDLMDESTAGPLVPPPGTSAGAGP